MEQDIRWRQRFQNFEKALILLREPLGREIGDLSELEKGGAIQRFEFMFELAWKTLKDYLEREGNVLGTVTPRSVIKEAFAARILRNGQVWINMLDHRNLLSHTYDESIFEDALYAIREHYMSEIEDLYSWFSQRREES